MTTRCFTPETICVQCGDRGFTNAFVYCVKCINVAMHRYCLNVIPSTVDEFVRWVCDDCGVEVQNQSVGQCKTKDHSTYSHFQVLERNLDGNFERHNMLFEDNNTQNVEQAQENVWRFKRPQTQGMFPSINLYYKPKVLMLVRSRLEEVGGPALLRRFQEGCFGHFLGWKNTLSCGRALHALISNEIELDNAPSHERWFRACGNNIRFSYHEYSLVSGLMFGTSDFDYQRQYDLRGLGLIERFCNGDEKINIQHLWSRFSMEDRVSDNDDDYLKVANLLVLYFFALGYGNMRRVDNFAWILVDHLEVWNKFPWGAYCYSALMHYMDLLPRNRIEYGGKYHFFGPVWALQIWAYEAIPYLAQFVAIEEHPDATPRCLKWLFIKPKKNEFDVLFEEELYACYQNLKPTSVEVESVYWTSAQRENALGLLFIAPVNPIYGSSKVAAKMVEWSKRSKIKIQPQQSVKKLKKSRDRVKVKDVEAKKRKGKRARSPSTSSFSTSASTKHNEAALDRCIHQKLDARIQQTLNARIQDTFDMRIQDAMDKRQMEFVVDVKEALLPNIKEYLKYELLPELKQFILNSLHKEQSRS